MSSWNQCMFFRLFQYHVRSLEKPWGLCACLWTLPNDETLYLALAQQTLQHQISLFLKPRPSIHQFVHCATRTTVGIACRRNRRGFAPSQMKFYHIVKKKVQKLYLTAFFNEIQSNCKKKLQKLYLTASFSACILWISHEGNLSIKPQPEVAQRTIRVFSKY